MEVYMDRNLAIEVVRVTEAAALASARLMGKGDEKAADQAAVDAMRKALNSIRMCGTVVIGEGERDEAPMLYIGEKVGCGNGGSDVIDIALDPLEGTTLTATGGPNALAVIAIAQNGNFLHAPDTYMEKIAVGPGAKGVIAASALRCVGGDMQGRLKPRNDEEIARAKKMGIKDINRIYRIEELAKGDVMFAATGVTDGDFLRGVRFFGGGAETHSIVMRSKTRTIRYITTTHHFEHKPNY